MKRFLLFLALLFLAAPADAASRYWVGGTNTWNSTAGTKWATSSGGAGGAAVPTSSDDVFFDANSGVSTVTMSGTRNVKTLTTTGFTGTLTAATALSLVPHGAIVFGSGTTLSGTWNIATAAACGGGSSITSNGVTLPNDGTATPISLSLDEGCTLTILDATVLSGAIETANSATLTISSVNVTATRFIDLGATTTVNLGTGTLSLTGTGTVWTLSATLTVNPSTSTIKTTDTSATSKTFSGGGKTYNNLWFSGGGTGPFIMVGNNTFANLRVDAPSATVNFTAGSTTTVTTLSMDGSSLGNNTLQSTSAGSAWNLAKGAGTINASYLTLIDSHAAGGATFNAANSLDGGGNTGWVITVIPTENGRFFAVFN